MIKVIQPTFGNGCAHYERDHGITISRHRTREAAERYVAKELRQLRKQPGMQGSWYDRRIIDEREYK